MSESIYGERELDVRVAEALGFVWAYHNTMRYPGDPEQREERRLQDPGERNWTRCSRKKLGLPLAPGWGDTIQPYSTDPAAYMGLLEEMERRGCNFVISGGSPYACSLWWKGHPQPVHEGRSKTLGEAISLAVLLALKAEDK